MADQQAFGDPEPIQGVVWPPNPVEISNGAGQVIFKEYVPPRSEVLHEADKLINGDRQKDYGTPEENFQRIADLWNTQFAKLLAPGKKFSPMDVALGMAQVKMGRMVQSPTRDSFVDAAGYIGLGYELSLLDE